MTRGRVFFVLVLAALWPGCAALAQPPLAIEELFSPSNARMFHKLAYELYILSEPDSEEANLAMILLNVALNLDNRAGYIFPDVLNLCSQFVEKDYSAAVDWAFKTYTDDKADLEVTKRAVRYLLEKMNIEVVETKASGTRSVCCGDDFYPKLSIEKIHKFMKKRADSMPCEDVCVYCISCIKSLHIGGKTPRHLIDLLMFEPTDPQIYDTVKWHDQLQEYIDEH